MRVCQSPRPDSRGDRGRRLILTEIIRNIINYRYLLMFIDGGSVS